MKRSRIALLGLAAAGIGAAVADRRQLAAWRAAVDPDGPDSLRFPEGEDLTITTSDGASLAVTVVGSGPTVVLAHGWTNSRAVWAPVARRLIRTGFRVVAYDQRGHGASGLGREPFSVARLGFDLRDILVDLDVHDAVLAGHSMGGMTIMSLIGDDPVAIKEHARAVVLVSTAAGGLGRNPRVDATVARLIGSRGVARLMAGPLGPRFTRGVVGAKPVYAHLDVMRAMWVATPGQVTSDAFVSMAAMDLRPGLAACPVPAIVAVGSRDQLTRQGLGKVIAEAIPGAELVVMNGAGHMLPIEEPDRVAELITRSSATP